MARSISFAGDPADAEQARQTGRHGPGAVVSIAVEHDIVFACSLLAALVLGVLLGLILIALGTVVALNWRGLGDRFADLMEAMRPTARRDATVDGWYNAQTQVQILAVVAAATGVGLLVNGVIAVDH